MDHREWLKLTETNPDAARQAYASGEVEFPDYMARPEPPTRSPQPTTLDGIKAQNAESQRRHDRAVDSMRTSSDELLPGRGEQREVAALPEGTEPIPHTRWFQISKRDPSKAMAYQRAGLVQFPDHIADALGA